MAVFVDLEDADVDPPQDMHRGWPGMGPTFTRSTRSTRSATSRIEDSKGEQQEDAREPVVHENPNCNPMARALGCYPIVMSLAPAIDLNTLDNLSRTCRQLRASLLQYRKMLLVSTLHCSNEHLPVDPDETLRFRVRAEDWLYMEDTGRTLHFRKARQCARDLVSACRRCGIAVCRNCAIKPPAPVVLRGRHRRLCVICSKTPLGHLVTPRLGPDVALESEDMQRAICRCASDGVWLCQPCGRTMRNDDYDYVSIWHWRNQYGESLGGLGTGIGDGDRGVTCGRADKCVAARDCEHETDCDAEDARSGAGFFLVASSYASSTRSHSSAASISSPTGTTVIDRPTPSPASLGPGYERHEIEGIGGVVKRKLVRMVKVGACVPEWQDENAKGDILGREVQGRARSFCGWCWRIIPGRDDYELEKQGQLEIASDDRSSSP